MQLLDYSVIGDYLEHNQDDKNTSWAILESCSIEPFRYNGVNVYHKRQFAVPAFEVYSDCFLEDSSFLVRQVYYSGA